MLNRTSRLLLTLTAIAPICGCSTGARAVDACALVDPKMAESLIGDRTGEPVRNPPGSEGRMIGCTWEKGEDTTLTVNLGTADEPAKDFYTTVAQGWKCTTALPVTEDDSEACRYEAALDTGIIARKGDTVIRIGYKGPGTPQHDRTQHPRIAAQLASHALNHL